MLVEVMKLMLGCSCSFYKRYSTFLIIWCTFMGNIKYFVSKK